MNAAELYLLGRKLMKIAESALPGPAAPGLSPATARLVALDISENPGTSIGEVAARTGFPQSQVSTSVARLRDIGLLQTSVDPADGRRTLVRLTEAARERARRASGTMRSIDDPLAAALGDGAPASIGQVTAALEMLAERLIPGTLSHVRDPSPPERTA